MTVLIFSGIGAMRMYPDKAMMRRTLTGFLNSLAIQTDKDFRLFLSFHDDPGIQGGKYPFVQWCQTGRDGETRTTRVPESLPKSVFDDISYRVVPYGSGKDDLSRGATNSIIEAFHWARDNRLKQFWLLRMDSDDLLARDTVDNIHKIDGQGFMAMFNRICHMYDPRRKEIAVHRYISSTTCHAVRFKIGDGGIPEPEWFYMRHNHSQFRRRIQRDKISAKELPFAYCICTNTGNNLSGRLPIDRERWCTRIALTPTLVSRYGLDSLMKN